MLEVMPLPFSICADGVRDVKSKTLGRNPGPRGSAPSEGESSRSQRIFDTVTPFVSRIHIRPPNGARVPGPDCPARRAFSPCGGSTPPLAASFWIRPRREAFVDGFELELHTGLQAHEAMDGDPDQKCSSQEPAVPQVA